MTLTSLSPVRDQTLAPVRQSTESPSEDLFPYIGKLCFQLFNSVFNFSSQDGTSSVEADSSKEISCIVGKGGTQICQDMEECKSISKFILAKAFVMPETCTLTTL